VAYVSLTVLSLFLQDVWGISGVEAEAELLSAMVTFFENVGLTSEDVGIKVNSRLVLSEVLSSLGVPEENFAATCVLVDKLEKVSPRSRAGKLSHAYPVNLTVPNHDMSLCRSPLMLFKEI
jgi:histidyl-tRNA synthetase